MSTFRLKCYSALSEIIWIRKRCMACSVCLSIHLNLKEWNKERNKALMDWESKQNMCISSFFWLNLQRRSTWALAVESMPQVILTVMCVCDWVTKRRWTGGGWTLCLTSFGIWTTWISSQNNLSKYRQGGRQIPIKLGSEKKSDHQRANADKSHPFKLPYNPG